LVNDGAGQTGHDLAVFCAQLSDARTPTGLDVGRGRCDYSREVAVAQALWGLSASYRRYRGRRSRQGKWEWCGGAGLLDGLTSAIRAVAFSSPVPPAP